MSPDDERHGSVAGYNAHRKHDVEPCSDCRRAMATYGASLAWDHLNGRTRVVNATGTARRIQALVFLGYAFGDIGRALGVSHDVARHYAVTRVTVRTATAEKVAELYERWSMEPAPDSKRAKYARTNARRRGWVGPLAWDDIDDPNEQPNLGGTDTQLDPVVVDRLLSLERVKSTPAEKVEAMRRWVASGRSQRSLCAAHGWQEGRYVVREEGAA